MPPVTSSVVAAVPREKAGQASAINNTSRQVGGALGVAVLGAILTSAYRAGIHPHLAAIAHLRHHPQAIDAASSSIAATLSFAAHAGPVGHTLVAPAVTSYVHAMHDTATAAVAAAYRCDRRRTLLPRRATVAVERCQPRVRSPPSASDRCPRPHSFPAAVAAHGAPTPSEPCCGPRSTCWLRVRVQRR